MAEQIFNLYVSQLASPYTAGSGTLSVTSASGLPLSGLFSIAILDAGTGAVIVVLTVTSITGTTLSVTAETADTSAAAGSAVKGPILSARSLPALIAQFASGAFLQPLTAPVAADFTQENFNVGSGVTSLQVNNSNSITLKQSDPNNTKNIIAIDMPKGNADFTLTVGFTMPPGGTNAAAGLYLSDGGGGPNIIVFGIQNGPISPGAYAPTGLIAFLFSNFTTFGSVIFAINAPNGFGPIFWVRIQETASARIYSASSDGITFAQIDSESNTAHFTTARVGIGISPQVGSAGTPDSMVTLYSFSLTTP